MRGGERPETAEELRARDRILGRAETRLLLDCFYLAAGDRRKRAFKVLRERRRRPLRRWGPWSRRGGSAFHPALVECWHASNHLCSRRLRPFLPDQVLSRRRHGQVSCSPAIEGPLTEAGLATVERNLSELRQVAAGRRMGQTRPRAWSGGRSR